MLRSAISFLVLNLAFSAPGLTSECIGENPQSHQYRVTRPQCQDDGGISPDQIDAKRRAWQILGTDAVFPLFGRGALALPPSLYSGNFARTWRRKLSGTLACPMVLCRGTCILSDSPCAIAPPAHAPLAQKLKPQGCDHASTRTEPSLP